MKRIDVRKTFWVLLSAGALAINASGQVTGTYANITIGSGFADWAGVPVAYTDEDGVNNPGGVDFQNVYLANDNNYLYIRFTLQQPADPISYYNTYIWLDGDTNPATGYHPFGNPNFGSSRPRHNLKHPSTRSAACAPSGQRLLKALPFKMIRFPARRRKPPWKPGRARATLASGLGALQRGMESRSTPGCERRFA